MSRSFDSQPQYGRNRATVAYAADGFILVEEPSDQDDNAEYEATYVLSNEHEPHDARFVPRTFESEAWIFVPECYKSDQGHEFHHSYGPVHAEACDLDLPIVRDGHQECIPRSCAERVDTTNLEMHQVWLTVPRDWLTRQSLDDHESDTWRADQVQNSYIDVGAGLAMTGETPGLDRWVEEPPQDAPYHDVEAFKVIDQGSLELASEDDLESDNVDEQDTECTPETWQWIY